MSEPSASSDPTAPDSAELQAFEEGAQRHPQDWTRWLVPSIAVAWSLFQLAVASFVILDSDMVRAIHLAFALLLTYLSFPCCRKVRFGLRFLARRDRLPALDIVLALAAAAAALYYVLDYEQIGLRAGTTLLTRDLICSVVLIVLLLEASRRVIGPALSMVSGTFIAYAFLGSHLPELIAHGGVSLNRFVSQMTMTSEGIYGVPLGVSASVVFLFVLFGAMLEKAGGGRFFIDLALSLLGPYRGGPAKAAVLSSGLTGMISGSSIANIVTTGTFTIPLMKKVGYPAKKAAAIEVAASTDGQLAPPIMGAAAFIIAEYVNVPYIAVVKAAAIPAFASYATLFYITHLEAGKLGLRGIPREQLRAFTSVLKSGLHYLVPLAVLLYLLIVVRRTPEMAAFHAVWVLAVLMLVQRPFQAWRAGDPVAPAWRRGAVELVAGLAAGGRGMVAVALATAAAGIIVGVVNLGLGGMITEVIATMSRGNIYLLLVITAAASLIIGMGLPTTATYIVVASLIAPAIVLIGGAQGFVVPLMAAHLFCFYFGILADDTPPVGLAAYAAAAIAKSDPVATGIQAFTYDIRTAILPFMFIFNADLILHGISRWDQGLLVFAAACIGNFAFAAATQGWYLTRTHWAELPLFLAITLIMLRPELIASWCGIPHHQRYWCFLFGLTLVGILTVSHRLRCRGLPPHGCDAEHRG